MRMGGHVVFAAAIALTATACASRLFSTDTTSRGPEPTESVMSSPSSSVDVVSTTAGSLPVPIQPANCSDLALGPVSLSDPRFDRVTEISNRLKAYGVSGFYVGAGASCDVTVTAGDLPPDIVEWLRSLRPPITLELGREIRTL